MIASVGFAPPAGFANDGLLSNFDAWHFSSSPSCDSPLREPTRELWRDGLGLIISRLGRSADERFRLSFTDDLAIEVSPLNRSIAIPATSAAVPRETIEHLIADQVVPRALAHLGDLVVHAAAVLIGKRLAVIVGPSGSGKSTLAASFSTSGASLLGDDALIMTTQDGRTNARAVYASLRLLPDSLAALYPPAHPSAAIAHYGAKRRVSVTVDAAVATEPLPVAAIFVLGDASGCDVKLVPINPASACMALIGNSFALDPTDRDRAAAKLQRASEIAEAVPAYALSYPRDYERLTDVRRTVIHAVEAA